MADKTTRIGEIVEVMLDTWNLPPDCNEGELFTYAETLYDRILGGDSKEALYAYLSGSGRAARNGEVGRLQKDRRSRRRARDPAGLRRPCPP